jgi:hypothetical protein
MATSTSCPQPRLEKKDGECCPQWTCHPSATGCQHLGLILESAQSVTDGCHVCTCQNGSVHCRSFCPPSSLPPRPGCQLVNISGQCCPQWQCQRESHLPRGVKSSVLIYFHGSCQSIVSEFLEDMKTKILSYVSSLMGCSNVDSDLAKFCDTLEIKIVCPGLSEDAHAYRKRRSVQNEITNSKTPVVISVHMNFSSTTPDLVTALHVKSTGLQLASYLNSSFSITLDNGQVITTAEGAQIEGESFICDHGFTFVKEFCVLSEIESKLSFKPNIQLTAVTFTNSSVTLEWPSLLEPMLKHVTGLLIEHRQEGRVQWLSSSRIDPALTSYTLTSLSPDQSVSARLVAITVWSGKERWTIGEVHFKTKSTPAAMSSRPSLQLTEITVTEHGAFFHWGTISDSAKIVEANVLYKQASQEQYQYKQCVSQLETSYVELKNLEPNTAYTAEVNVILSTDSTMKSQPVHFVTLALRSGSAELLIAVVVSCVVTALTSVILSLACVLWRQNRKKKNNGFENKIFGIQLENNNEEISTESSSNPAVN